MDATQVMEEANRIIEDFPTNKYVLYFSPLKLPWLSGLLCLCNLVKVSLVPRSGFWRHAIFRYQVDVKGLRENA